MSTLEARLRLRRPGFVLQVALELPASGVTGVFGASGSGKTTFLRCLAGLEPEAEGVVRLGSSTWQDTGGVFLPPHRRSVGCVFQEPDLFSHLTVEGNLLYALRRSAGRSVDFDEAVAWLGLEPLLGRATGGLSGGERQRVSVARALLRGPRLLLLDEPLSALDEPGRKDILRRLEALPSKLSVPVVYVSHTLAEVARLAHRLVWLVDGEVRGVGPSSELVGRMDFARWRGDEAAVVVEATVREHDAAYELTLLEGPWGPLWVRRQEAAPGERLKVWIGASDVSVSLEAERASSVLNRFRLDVLEVEEAGSGQVLVRLGSAGEGRGPVLLARITRLSRDRLGVAAGARVYAGVKSVAVVE